ncbi:ribosome assembly RNA-binding protein YhbY [Legionella dresdenensis]|uniref:Ribosome assembly RNA-binding protein YhbY n=1 Tax=Legionella dresdenensis TaxID=450200 RepID=A0ABV8CG45_9GAMM
MKSEFRKELKARAHHLKPVVLLGAKGLTQAVIEETDVALNAHELIKVKINGAERDDRRQMAIELCEQLAAELVQTIGNTIVVYRKKPE